MPIVCLFVFPTQDLRLCTTGHLDCCLQLKLFSVISVLILVTMPMSWAKQHVLPPAILVLCGSRHSINTLRALRHLPVISMVIVYAENVDEALYNMDGLANLGYTEVLI